MLFHSVIAAVLLAKSIVGFAPVSLSKHANLRSSSRRFLKTTILTSTTESQSQSQSNERISARPFRSAESEGVAIESLKRLMERQIADLEETKRALHLYQHTKKLGNETRRKGPSRSVNGGLTESDESPPELLSVASSFLKGQDYGFVSRSEGPSFGNLHGGHSEAFVGYGPPGNLWELGIQQFMRNLKAMRDEYEDEEDVELTPKQIDLREKLERLTLNSTAIWEREAEDGPIEGPYVIKLPYLFLCYMLDAVFEDRYVPSRFFLLETVARMPYFSYITMLHLYESLGFWRRSADVKRIHFAEEINEFHHLMIMESLGGDQRWWVRFMAQHSAIAYYMGLCLLWALSPSLSYKFSELLESHAVNTYSQFLDENEDLLKSMPPSIAAVTYYSLGSSDPYYAEFQTSAITQNREVRRPGIEMTSLYDVFAAIRDDEADHVSTMEACLDPTVAKLSPSLEKRTLTALAAAAAIGFFLSSGVTDFDAAGGNLADTVADETLVDATLAGVADTLSRLGTEAEQGMAEEGTVLVGIRALANELSKILSRFL